MTEPAARPTPSTPVEHVEIERSYDAPPGGSLPDLTGVPGVVAVRTEPVMSLDATYLDTAGLALTRARTTLRRRAGGTDDGWHLKLPASADLTARRELHAPLGDDVPAGLLDAVAEVVGCEPLLPLVRVRNERTVTLLVGADGVLAEVCDDHVRTEGLRDGVPSRAWTEWEVELVGGDEPFLDAVEQVLVGAGATRLQVGSKLARALGR